jgi:hypothetical protein
LLVWYFLWRNEDKKRQALHDCEICTLEKNQYYKNRVCFNPNYGEEAYSITVPHGEPETKVLLGSDQITFDSETFLDWLYDFNETFKPEMPAFEIINKLINPANKNKICMSSFIDMELGYLVDLESSCNNYHCLPYEGGLLDQPMMLMDVFGVIRGERNKFEAQKADALMQNLKNSGSEPKGRR